MSVSARISLGREKSQCVAVSTFNALILVFFLNIFAYFRKTLEVRNESNIFPKSLLFGRRCC
jgi:hypothetical protein